MKKKWWNSLRIKIITWSFVPTALILSAVAWFTFYSYQKVLGDLAVEQDWVLAQSKAVEAHTALANVINGVLRPVILAIDLDYEKPLAARAQNILDQAQGLDFFDGGIYFLDQDGIIFRTQPPQPELIGKDWSDTPQFRFIKENPPGSAPITDLRTTGPDEKEIICASWPMHNTKTEFIGAGYYCLLVESTRLTILNQTFGSLELGLDVTIIDGYQNIIFSPDASQIGKNISGEAYIQQLFQESKMSIRYKNETGERVISYYPLANVVSAKNRWILIKEQSLDEIMQPSLPYRRLLYALLALGVIVPVLVTAYGVRHITEPIKKLILASGKVTEGDFRHHIEVRTGDEIETLSDQFNLMSARLDESYLSLEKKVADRTRELAIMNAILSVASRSLDVHEILDEALNIIIKKMGFKAGAAFSLVSDPSAPLLVSCRGFEHTIAPDLASARPIKDWILHISSPSDLRITEIKDIQEEALRDELVKSGYATLVLVPLSTKGHDLGFFLLGWHLQDPLSHEETSLLNSIGQQIGVAMEIASLYEQAEQAATAAERHRLARELHDAVTQTLFSANLIADVIPRIWKRDPDEGMKNLEELRQLTRGALAEMRTMLLEMRPESLERTSITSLLTQLSDAFIGRVRVPVSLDLQGNCEPIHEVKLVFYRVAQEALNNIAKHSDARQVVVKLECQPGHMRLGIQDDGLGFDPAAVSPDHLGMVIMHERAASIAATLRIDSRPGTGTRVELDWIFAG